ncbi:MAG: polysulfide reductase NrfD [Fimbriimonadaceae bacterium]|nr:polysulfide reductase NrfD [Fimbriimonadaceae bacterium]
MALETREPTQDVLITGEQSYATMDSRIGDIVLNQKIHQKRWWMILGAAFLLVNVLLISIAYLVYQGIGIWGNNQPVGWAFDIINFVWWIGIGHAGTLISAILLLLRQQWRNSINRFAEAMTLFAVMCAGLFPLLHTGRPWVAYWLFPYPNILGMWPQFRSPLIWDVFAVTTYITVSALFWFVGLIPDFATLRDRAKKTWVKKVFGMLAMGWTGSVKHWHRYEAAYLILAGLSTPLVLSVHSIVSLDFAVSIVPGWNVTLFPPYFVAGAVFAGFAMVLTLAIPARKWYHLEDYITDKHLDWCAKIMLATGLIVFYGYLMEVFYAWYSGNPYELALLKNRMQGPYAIMFWSLWFCNGLAIQPLWSKKVRSSTLWLLVISTFVSIGMWLERFVIIPMSLSRDYMPSAWGMYYPTWWDIGMFAGTIGFFIFMMLLFIRFLPMINIFEMKDLLHRTGDVDHRKPAAAPIGNPAPSMGGGKGGE